jgi:hypothetical protein
MPKFDKSKKGRHLFMSIYFVVDILMIILLMSAICSCSPEYRLRSLLKHHPELSHDKTTFIHDTVITKSERKDSMFFFNQKDTVVIEKGRLLMKYFYTHDSVFLSGQCKADTIIKTIPVKTTVVRNVAAKEKWGFWKFFGVMALGVLIFIVLLIGCFVGWQFIRMPIK